MFVENFNIDSLFENSSIMLIFCIIYFFAFLFSVAIYIFEAIGLYSISKNRGLNYPIFAFFPVFSTYLLGKVSDDIQSKKNKKSNYAVLLTVLEIVLIFILFIMSVFAVLLIFEMGKNSAEYQIVSLLAFLLLCFAVFAISIATSIFIYIALYRIYKEYQPQNATLYLVLSILFGNVVIAALFFIIRNQKPYNEKMNTIYQ